MAQTWAITWDGEVYREMDLTVGECEDVLALTGGSWDAIVPSASPTSLRATLSVLLKRKGIEVAESMTKLRDVSAVEMLRAVSWEDEDDRPDVWQSEAGKLPTPDPKAATSSEASSTTTSPSSPTSSTGRRTKQDDAPSETSD